MLDEERIKAFTMTRSEKAMVVDVVKSVLSREDNVLMAFLYGSFLEDRPFRDVDIGIVLREGSDVDHFYEFELADRLERSVGGEFPFDVRVVNNAPFTFLYYVVQGELLVCRDRDAYADLVTAVARRYHDIEPVLRHYRKEAYG